MKHKCISAGNRPAIETGRKPKYGVRKLSIGVVSCFLGCTIFFGTGNMVHAEESTLSVTTETSSTVDATDTSNVGEDPSTNEAPLPVPELADKEENEPKMNHERVETDDFTGENVGNATPETSVPAVPNENSHVSTGAVESVQPDTIAETENAVQEISIPDEAFRAKLNQALSTEDNQRDPKAVITQDEMSMITDLVIFFDDTGIENIEGIQYAVNLRRLLIRKDVKNLEQIKGLSKIEELELSEFKDAYTDFSFLGNKPSLTSLEFSSSSGLTSLNGLTAESTPKLETLDCHRCIHLEDLSALNHSTFRQLSTVDLEGTGVVDITPLKNCPNLKTLDLEKIELTENNRAGYSETIQSLINLETLHMPYCELKDSDTVMFKPLTKLKQLLLNMNNLTKIDFCEFLPADLKVLSLHGNEITNMDYLKRFTDMTHLGIGDNGVTDLSFLNQLPRLQGFGIRHVESREDFPTLQTVKVTIKESDIKNGMITIDNPFKGVDGEYIAFDGVQAINHTGEVLAEIQSSPPHDKLTIKNRKTDSNFYMDFKAPYRVNLKNGLEFIANAMIKLEIIKSADDIPTAQVTYSNAGNWTNQDVTAEIKISEPVKDIPGWTKVDQQTFTKVFSHNAEETVTITDHTDNTSTVQVNVQKIDKKAPEIRGVQDLVLVQGETFDAMAGVSAYDNESGEIEAKDIQVTVVNKPSIDMDIIGIYELNYSVSDLANNTTTVKRLVSVTPKEETVNHAPSIKADDLTLTVGDLFDPLTEVHATDKEDGDMTLTKENIIANDVDTSKAGTYHVTYRVTDKNGTFREKTITVTVQAGKIKTSVNTENATKSAEQKPSSKPNTTKSDSTKTALPKTGDITNVAGLLGGLVVSLGALLALCKKKRS